MTLPSMSNSQDKLERFIDRTLREQPLQSAPASLERGVLTELARRAALPWWRKSFSHWPLVARAVFVAASIGLAKLGADIAVWVVAGLRSSPAADALATEIGTVQAVSSALYFVFTSWALLVQSIPTLWLYGGMALVMVLYASVFGLSAVAYRTLYATR